MNLQNAKLVLDVVEPIVTIAAILAGLWWFIIRRASAKKVNIEHVVQFVPLGSETYVGVTVTISNIGNTRIRNISPSDEPSSVIIEEVAPYLKRHRASQVSLPEYRLKFLGGRVFPEIIELEPGEQQRVLFEFIIPQTTTAIKVYSFIDNPASKGLGWNSTTIHEVTFHEDTP